MHLSCHLKLKADRWLCWRRLPTAQQYLLVICRKNIEVVRNQECTYAAGQVCDLAEKLRKLIAHPEQVQSIRDHVSELVKKQHTWNEVIGGYDAVYNENRLLKSVIELAGFDV